MKKLTLALSALMLSGCAATISAPQNITENTELAKSYVAYQPQLQGPSIEVLSYFHVGDASISEEGDIVLKGRFKIHNKNYQTDTDAEMIFGASYVNLGNDRIAIKEASLNSFDLNSVHRPINSEVNKAAKLHGLKIAAELGGKVIEGQSKLAITNAVNETFRIFE